MSGSATTAPSRSGLGDHLTFGIEYEFLVPYLFSDENDPLKHVDDLSPLFRIYRNNPIKEDELVVYDTLTKLFDSHGLPTKVGACKYDSDFAKKILDRYSYWNIDEDESVQEPEFNNPYALASKYKWINVEIATPAEPDIQIAYDTSRYVLQLLQRTYRVRVNLSCGLHVHVGKGVERFDLREMKRIGSLIWSTEHLLGSFNHPVRQVSYHAPTVRTRSIMSGFPKPFSGPQHEWSTSSGEVWNCGRYISTDVRPGEEPASWREQNQEPEIVEAFQRTRQEGHYEPFQWNSPDAPSTAAEAKPTQKTRPIIFEQEFRTNPQGTGRTPRVRTLPQLVTRPNEEHEKMLEGFEEVLETYRGNITFTHREADPGVWEGVRQLSQAPTACDIAYLLRVGSRSYVSTTNYICTRIASSTDPRTIEFRCAEGTLSDWSITWGRICVGLIKFAIQSSTAEFLNVIDKCDLSMREGGRFDCIDLLDAIGLPTEAELAERHIQENSEEWRIQFLDT
ncbi:hypothetical protein F4804DRAFT_212864 [Jackrogersella minutella]|nr:hypothetical protein F4804DRAFT_212864 [Jackrogersella minutella]